MDLSPAHCVVRISPAVLLVGVLAAGAFAQERPKPEQVLKHDKLEVVLPDFPAEGLILDIGGGGEGVVGQLKGRQAVAIDLIKRELEDAPGEPLLKIVMDARDLKFLDNTFPTATVFFTFMYIEPSFHAKVLEEIRRVLKPGGRLLVWDVVFPARTDPQQVYVLFPVHVKMPKGDVNTGYGVKIVEKQGLEHFADLARQTGFEVVTQEPQKGWFFLELRKPA